MKCGIVCVSLCDVKPVFSNLVASVILFQASCAEQGISISEHAAAPAHHFESAPMLASYIAAIVSACEVSVPPVDGSQC